VQVPKLPITGGTLQILQQPVFTRKFGVMVILRLSKLVLINQIILVFLIYMGMFGNGYWTLMVLHTQISRLLIQLGHHMELKE